MRRIGAPRSGTLLMRSDGAGVMLSGAGVLLAEAFRDMRNLGCLTCFSGEFTALCAIISSAYLLKLRGWGASSSELSPTCMFCIIGALSVNPCDMLRIASGESRRDNTRVDGFRDIREFPYDGRGVGEAVAISKDGSRLLLNVGISTMILSDVKHQEGMCSPNRSRYMCRVVEWRVISKGCIFSASQLPTCNSHSTVPIHAGIYYERTRLCTKERN